MWKPCRISKGENGLKGVLMNALDTNGEMTRACINLSWNVCRRIQYCVNVSSPVPEQHLPWEHLAVPGNSASNHENEAVYDWS